MAAIYVSHGDKGGIGKTYFASVLTDYLLEHGKKVLAIDGDISMDRHVSNADFASRFKNTPGVSIRLAPLNTPTMGVDTIYSVMEDVVGLLEQGSDMPDVVINTPANFSHTFSTEVQKLLRGLAEEFGLALRVIYLMGGTNIAQSAALQIIRDEVLESRHLVFAFPTKDRSADSWREDAKGVVDFFLEKGIGFFLPKMSQTLVRVYEQNPDRSFAHFFPPDEPLSMKDRLLQRMIRTHLDEVYPLIERYVLAK